MAIPQRLKAIVDKIVSYGNGVYKVQLSLQRNFPRFKPGQFLHLAIDSFDPSTGFWPESRVFSIAGCDVDRRTVFIVYSVKGSYTKRMERELEVGKDVWLKGPYGEFIISHYLRENDTAVLIAGGTGISPFIPFLTEQKSQFRVELFYGVRSPDVLIFDQALSEVSTRTKERIHLFLEELDESRNADLGKRFEIHRGQLCISDILEITEQKANRVFFLSGPPSMIDTFKKELQNHGILENNIIIDEWG